MIWAINLYPCPKATIHGGLMRRSRVKYWHLSFHLSPSYPLLLTLCRGEWANNTRSAPFCGWQLTTHPHLIVWIAFSFSNLPAFLHTSTDFGPASQRRHKDHWNSGSRATPFIPLQRYYTSTTHSINMPLLPHGQSWWRLVRQFGTPIVKGASITLGSTILSCVLAIQIEATGHQVLFYCRPHWYKNVAQAHGLTAEQLNSVRGDFIPPTILLLQRQETQATSPLSTTTTATTATLSEEEQQPEEDTFFSLASSPPSLDQSTSSTARTTTSTTPFRFSGPTWMDSTLTTATTSTTETALHATARWREWNQELLATSMTA